MSESPLMIKSKAFALEVIRACKVLREAECESALINQFFALGNEHWCEYSRGILCTRKGGFCGKATYRSQGMLRNRILA